jgi:multiple sugar transport system permease protein
MSAETYSTPFVPSTTTGTDAERRRALLQLRLRRAGIYVVAMILALWILLPIIFITSLALSTPAGVRSFPKTVIPDPVSLDTLTFFLSSEGIGRAATNSILVAVLTLMISTIFAVPAGYGIARYLFPGRDAIRLLILSVRAFPIVVLAVPLAVIFLRLGMFDQPFSLALMHTALTLPTTILVISSVFVSVPYEFEEAARVFGCTPFQAFLKVVLPLAIPGIAASAILSFVLSWNEVFAAIMLTVSNRTLPAQILYTLDKSSDPFKFAAAFFMLIPSLVFIFVIRRYLFNMWGSVNK